jgi:AcrR family transcriptional regulator
MSENPSRALRRDAARNRERLVEAAREMFAAQGHDVPLEDVARAADVSRTTLYRNFTTREELAATVYEDNVALIEKRSMELRDAPDGVVQLLDFVLAMQSQDRSLSRMLSSADIHWFEELSARTAAAFEPLLSQARQEGIVHPGVEVEDILLAFPMAGGAMADVVPAGSAGRYDRLRLMLHRALFTVPD